MPNSALELQPNSDSSAHVTGEQTVHAKLLEDSQSAAKAANGIACAATEGTPNASGVIEFPPYQVNGAENLGDVGRLAREVQQSMTEKGEIQNLSTGDTLIRESDKQILIAPNGDKITVNDDGSIDLKCKEQVKVSQDPFGETVLTFPNGDRVVVSNNEISSVQRGGTTEDVSAWNQYPSMFPPGAPYDPQGTPGWRGEPGNVVPIRSGLSGGGVSYKESQSGVSQAESTLTQK